MAFPYDDEEKELAMGIQRGAMPGSQEAPVVDPYQKALSSRDRILQDAEAAYNEERKKSTRDWIAQALMGIGGALSGRDNSRMIMDVDQNRQALAERAKAGRERKAENLFQEAQQIIERERLAKKEQQRADMDDPNSPYSKQAREALSDAHKIPELKDLPLTKSQAESYIIQDRQEKNRARRLEQQEKLFDKREAGKDRRDKEVITRKDQAIVDANRNRFLGRNKDLIDGLRKADLFKENVELALDNPVAKAGLGFTAARVAGSNSQLSDAERQIFQRFGKLSPATIDQARRDIIDGTLNPQYANYYKAWAEVIGNRAKDVLRQERDAEIQSLTEILQDPAAFDFDKVYSLPGYQKAAPAPGAGFSPDKAARLKVLREKKAKGTLK